MSHFKTYIASLLIVCLTSLSMPMQAFAAIVTTEEAMASSGSSGERDRVASFLSRDDVRKSLEAQGVDPQAAIERIATLSDQEVQQLAARIDNAPAGGDILGILFTVFIVLLVTDILGLTKVFPFTRSIR
ncbi:PA2779 family protein [Janthinobacterium sp. 17J80-10]|uniref:PA2779 family protein n=1 Tax=Janthinobacterium sp. 17J80-10 TaxID=2497863 RepID=UPI0010059874|nr:PA2779 family protein [Janthinobacterium sp. 17J80-10]QAU33707.1 hypothetical protein EKL02_05640 [Janthinobacterium sp. 17J80-10]